MPLLLLALALLLFASCTVEPLPIDLAAENAKADAAFAVLVATRDWQDAGRNSQGLREAKHEVTGLTFVLIPAGHFSMGSNDGNADEQPVRKVSVGAFLMCTTECTQQAWVRGGGRNASRREGEDLPVVWSTCSEYTSWCETVGLRLPSEAEWEYACRAGSAGNWCFGNDEKRLKEYAVYGSTKLGEVRSKKPNAWGLADCHGNVAEWCDSPYTRYERSLTERSARRTSGLDSLVRRGGSYYDSAAFCRSASRDWGHPDRVKGDAMGFRPAASLPK